MRSLELAVIVGLTASQCVLMIKAGLTPVAGAAIAASFGGAYVLVRHLFASAERPAPARIPVNTIAAPQPFDPTLQIASETLPIMRQGFNSQTALETAEIIQKISDVAAVAITDRERVLAFVGAGCDKHRPGDSILTEATKQVIATGEMRVIENQRQLSCPRTDECDCPLASAAIVPLTCRGETVGTLKMYQTRDGVLPRSMVRLASGLAQLLSIQIEMSELDRQAQLVTRAELDALRAQINPHFLFNTLNAIIMYSRTDPAKARRLLIRLADFFRQNLKQLGHFQPLRAELQAVRTYLYLERSRYHDKLQIHISVDPHLRDVEVPVLILQPLVENAIRHGIGPKLGPGRVELTVTGSVERLAVRVRDDGVGMTPERLSLVLTPGVGSGNGVGLSNVYERLRRLYGADLSFQMESTPGAGTCITMQFPGRLSGSVGGGGEVANATQSPNR